MLTLIAALVTTSLATAGQHGSEVPWISDVTPSADLVLNNDDYQGAFADNPNHFTLDVETIVGREEIIPTRPTGGVTEYAITVGGSYSDGHARPGITLDSMFTVELGFGTGSNFVPASRVAPGLMFDQPDNVNPAIEDYFFFIGDTPILKLIAHEGDTLLYQGSSTSGAISSINFGAPELFTLPLDIPDLPQSVRDFYSVPELAGLTPDDIPFTIRVQGVPEPTTLLLAAISLVSLLLVRSRYLSRD